MLQYLSKYTAQIDSNILTATLRWKKNMSHLSQVGLYEHLRQYLMALYNASMLLKQVQIKPHSSFYFSFDLTFCLKICPIRQENVLQIPIQVNFKNSLHFLVQEHCYTLAEMCNNKKGTPWETIDTKIFINKKWGLRDKVRPKESLSKKEKNLTTVSSVVDMNWDESLWTPLSLTNISCFFPYQIFYTWCVQYSSRLGCTLDETLHFTD